MLGNASKFLRSPAMSKLQMDALNSFKNQRLEKMFDATNASVQRLDDVMDTDTLTNTLGNIDKGLTQKMSVQNINQRYKIGNRKASPQLMLRGISSVGLMLKKQPIADPIKVSQKMGHYAVQNARIPSMNIEQSNEDQTKSIAGSPSQAIETKYHGKKIEVGGNG